MDGFYPFNRGIQCPCLKMESILSMPRFLVIAKFLFSSVRIFLFLNSLLGENLVTRARGISPHKFPLRRSL
jgi:hypothetical protein